MFFHIFRSIGFVEPYEAADVHTGWDGYEHIDMVCFVVELLDPQLWVVLRDFVGFVLEVGFKTSLDDLSPVFGTDDNVVIAEVDGVGIVYVVHTSILPRGAEEAASASIPRAYARGFTCAVKEMLQLAEREDLEIVEIKRESHSAKETDQRPVFNEIIEEIRQGKFTGILTWAPDRISRNAGDLGKIVDLMDAKLLIEIRTFGQRFTNSPSEKFLLMILGSQAKLENDNRGINVKRGLRTKVEMGLWPGVAPLGYLNQKLMDKKCQIAIYTGLGNPYQYIR